MLDFQYQTYQEESLGFELPDLDQGLSRTSSLSQSEWDEESNASRNNFVRYLHEGSDFDLLQDTLTSKPWIPETAGINSKSNELDGNISLQGTNVLLLFRYASLRGKVFLVLGVICAIVGGSIPPVMTIVFGDVSLVLSKFALGLISKSHFLHEMSTRALYYVLLGLGRALTSFICTMAFVHIGDEVTRIIRKKFLVSLLRQKIEYYDAVGLGELATRMSVDMNQIQNALSQNVAVLLTDMSGFVSAFVVIFTQNWRLGFLSLAGVAALLLVRAIPTRSIVRHMDNASNSLATSGSVAEETIVSIRTSLALGAQVKLTRQYDAQLQIVESSSIRARTLFGLVISAMIGTVSFTYALLFWQGSRFLVDGKASAKEIVTTIYAIVIGTFSIAKSAPLLEQLAAVKTAAGKILPVIESQTPKTANWNPKRAAVGSEWNGQVEFKGVSLAYPSRPNITVHDNFSLPIRPGETTALVGPSGSGKSSIIALLEQFYEPTKGEILIGNHNIEEFDLNSLRQRVSLVEQEPVLFHKTVRNNIFHGLTGTGFEYESAKSLEDRLISAAKIANADNFIRALPQGYDTEISQRGDSLSGGQKQRIAIARAIIRDPTLLLLDEATSALDSESEGIVQRALENASKGRTTIVVAHRLSTIRNAENIVFIDKGRIIEQGTHDDLVRRQGAYWNMVQAQTLKDASVSSTVGKPLRSNSLCEANRSEYRPARSSPLRPPGTIPKVRPSTTTSRHANTWTLIKLIASLNRPDWIWLVFGIVHAFLAGSGLPVQAIFVAKAITASSKPPSQYSQLRHDINKWSIMYLWFGAFLFLVNFLYLQAFARTSGRLLRRVRQLAFKGIFRQEMDFFRQNPAGSLVAFFGTQAEYIASLSGASLGNFVVAITVLIASAATSNAINWQLGLVGVSTMPILLGCGYYRQRVLNKIRTNTTAVYEASTTYACEAVANVRTVASLTREQAIINKYDDQLQTHGRETVKANLWAAGLFAASQSLPLFCMALEFWYGGVLISENKISAFAFFVVYLEINFGCQNATGIFSDAPDFGNAFSAATFLRSLFAHFQNMDDMANERRPLQSCEGNIEFKHVTFKYPGRTEPAIRDLNISIKSGSKVALVGASGAGKSTVINLLERFYAPSSGAIYLDNVDISSLDVKDYRSRFGLVDQVAALYSGTIRENLLLGVSDDVHDQEILEVCRDAGIYDFVMSLPDGLDTAVGSKGVLMSGGQKQRLCIARALMRRPKILLLDESTSALDSESERLVQEALNKASEGRTIISIAHRLSTIQDYDVIFVFDEGRIVERGTHSELIDWQGVYYRHVQQQAS
ncbi:hypothetical protein H2200_002510 [Cladophialophora chaetospira]|uniref:Uncharacterized protein n=1 Tax=Cladophialophora chaetospira TaxID=386627 RepID=A0AA38XJ53_9EURO|nr:hypothetical protein H2200_002510 [Cladophialophora chaetospira]